MQWEEGESFDLESMKCVTKWSPDSMVIESDQFTIKSVWRKFTNDNEIDKIFEYYLDPFSEKVLELGTLEHPFRSMMNVLVEIINLHSNSDSNIIIYTKDVFIEDESMVFLNISSITIKRHPYYELIHKNAIIIPTRTPQIGISKKSLFHLHK